MTLNDFLRNQRGLNDGVDFPPEYLERIYNNIRTREIVMPDEHVGELKEEYQWRQIVENSRQPAARLLSAEGVNAYDREVCGGGDGSTPLASLHL